MTELKGDELKRIAEIEAERKRLETDFTLGWSIDDNPQIAVGIIERAWGHIDWLLDLAKDGLKYRFLMEHDPVGVEEIQYMIQSNLERTANATPAAADEVPDE